MSIDTISGMCLVTLWVFGLCFFPFTTFLITTLAAAAALTWLLIRFYVYLIAFVFSFLLKGVLWFCREWSKMH